MSKIGVREIKCSKCNQAQPLALDVDFKTRSAEDEVLKVYAHVAEVEASVEEGNMKTN